MPANEALPVLLVAVTRELVFSWRSLPGSLALAGVVLPLRETLWKSLGCREVHSCPQASGLNPTKTSYSPDPVCVCSHSPRSGSGKRQSEQAGEHSRVPGTLQRPHNMTAGTNNGKRGTLHFFGCFYKHLPSLFAPAQQLDPAKLFKMNSPTVLADQSDIGHC